MPGDDFSDFSDLSEPMDALLLNLEGNSSYRGDLACGIDTLGEDFRRLKDSIEL